ncbi:MAG: LysM peptidoglycan-binding domain-containing protein [Treponema sp.]|nr:LysM peptidoglycan-binding domain-containing protein [Treponema sp.]
MNRKLLNLLVLLFVAVFCFAQEADFQDDDSLEIEFQDEDYQDDDSLEIEFQDEDYQEDDSLSPDSQEEETEATSAGVSSPVEIPSEILNNQYYLESIRLNELAKEAFEEGNYDASADYAERAAEYARLSDEYVNMRLAETAFERAHSRYTWAGSVGAATRYPAQYRAAVAAYNEAVAARQAENWDNTFDASNRVLAALANVKGFDGESGSFASALPPKPIHESQRPAQGTLPAQYTVRQWNNTGDCFSAIASWSWVYGDAYQWRKLYEANKHKLPNPDNPHLMLPGMVLDIPSLQGETRSGMWNPSAEY